MKKKLDVVIAHRFWNTKGSMLTLVCNKEDGAKCHKSYQVCSKCEWVEIHETPEAQLASWGRKPADVKPFDWDDLEVSKPVKKEKERDFRENLRRISFEDEYSFIN